MNRVTIHYEGRRVGTLAEARGGIVFEYDPAFIAAGHELSPFHLPLGAGLRWRGPAPSPQLPGLFENSLPDAWGRRVMREWFRRQGVPAHTITPLAMLIYVGARGMGALTYEPANEPASAGAGLTLPGLYEAAQRLDTNDVVDLPALAAVGSTAGGARPKALLALPRGGDGPPRDGAGNIPADHDAWLVKFDTSPDASAGPMEEAYARMARAAGIDLPESRLLETRNGGEARRHFAVKRFDREGSVRIHHHTLAALCQTGGGDLDYTTLLRATRRLAKDEGEVWRAFRRAAFNVLASNRDDHGKNHGFVYRGREWKLGPAYDLTFQAPEYLPERGMALLGERRDLDAAALLQLAASEALDRRQALAVLDEVKSAVGRWREFATAASVPALRAAEVDRVLAAGLS